MPRIKNDSFAIWFSNALDRSRKTQQEIATECGISPSYITILKTKSCNRRPSIGTLAILAKALEVDLCEAFQAAGIETPLLIEHVDFAPILSASEKCILAGMEKRQKFSLIPEGQSLEEFMAPFHEAKLSKVETINMFRRLILFCAHRELKKLTEKISP